MTRTKPSSRTLNWWPRMASSAGTVTRVRLAGVPSVEPRSGLSGGRLTNDGVGMGIRNPDQLDWVAWPDRSASDHPGHLTRAATHRFERITVHFEHFPACRAVAGDLELGVADPQPRAVGKLHDLHALDGHVLTQHAGLHRHPPPRQLVDCLGIENADLAQRSPSMAVAFQAEVGNQSAFRSRHLAKLLFQVGVHRDKARHAAPNGIGSSRHALPFPAAR